MTTVINLVKPSGRRHVKPGDPRMTITVARCPLIDPDQKALRIMLAAGYVIGSHTDYPEEPA